MKHAIRQLDYLVGKTIKSVAKPAVAYDDERILIEFADDSYVCFYVGPAYEGSVSSIELIAFETNGYERSLELALNMGIYSRDTFDAHMKVLQARKARAQQQEEEKELKLLAELRAKYPNR